VVVPVLCVHARRTPPTPSTDGHSNDDVRCAHHPGDAHKRTKRRHRRRRAKSALSASKASYYGCRLLEQSAQHTNFCLVALVIVVRSSPGTSPGSAPCALRPPPPSSSVLISSSRGTPRLFERFPCLPMSRPHSQAPHKEAAAVCLLLVLAGRGKGTSFHRKFSPSAARPGAHLPRFTETTLLRSHFTCPRDVVGGAYFPERRRIETSVTIDGHELKRA